MSTIFKVFLLFNSVTGLFAEESDLLVETPLGSVQGFHKISIYGRSYRAFEGIPYAKPPVQDLRFEVPVPYGSWNGTIQATSPGNACVQFSATAKNPLETPRGDEDCLYLNIYTPLLSQAKNKSQLYPVLLWIHGGRFNEREGHAGGSTYIMNRDLVYVNFNYRLGLFGFLSTGDEIVPGNMGLKDQSLALRWVHENIEFFGGDPGRITLFGDSSGAACVQYHYLSPMSRGLFQGGISISGTTLSYRMFRRDIVEKTMILGSVQGCPTNSTRDMVKCLKSQSAESIMQKVGQFQPSLFNQLLLFGPVVEKNSTTPFIDRSPVEIITSGDAADLPWITSDVSDEGIIFVAEYLTDEESMAQLDEHWGRLGPYLLELNSTIPSSQHAQAAEIIREHYLGEQRIEKATGSHLIRMFGDGLFTASGGKAAKLMAKYNRSPVWFYYYSYNNTFTLPNIFGVTENFGVCHGDDFNLILAHPKLPIIEDQPTLDTQKILLDIFESFAYNGVPKTDIPWPRVDPSTADLEYLHIPGPEGLRAESGSDFGNHTFWFSIGFV